MWSALLVAVGLFDVWGSRYNLNPDGISYLEMARHAVAGAPDGLINGYWSPGYPVLLAPVMALLDHEWVTAIPALHLVNLPVYILAGWLLVRLLREQATAPVADPGAATNAWAKYAFPFGVAAFLLIAIKSIGLGLLTPDMGVMVAVLATVGCCMRLERPGESLRWSVALGVVLGVGYWLKGIMLPLNALLLLALFLVPPRTQRTRRKIVAAASVFAFVALPLVAMVSARVGRVTFGEVGRLNYAWEISGVTPFIGWVGDSGAPHGTPIHPPRVLQAAPQTLEFGTPMSASYALWFDPSYWYAGVRAHFDGSAQWQVLRKGLDDLWLMLQQQLVLIVGLLALVAVTVADRGRGPRSHIPVVLGLWSVAAMLVYALVHVEPRYLAGFTAVLVVVTWTALARRTPRRAMPWVMCAVVIAMLISVGENLRENTGGYQAAFRPDYLLEAAKLKEAGLVRGDRVAMVGDAFEAYAAFAVGATITVQVMDSTGFWQLTPYGRAALQRSIAATGVKALLANNVGTDIAPEGWRLFVRDDSSNLGVLLLAPR